MTDRTWEDYIYYQCNGEYKVSKPRELYHDDQTWVPKKAYNELQAQADRLAEIAKEWRRTLHDFSPTAIMLDATLADYSLKSNKDEK